MTVQQSNADAVAGFYEAMARGDHSAMALFAEDVEFHMPEVLPHGGTIQGRDALGAYFGEVMGRWDDFRVPLDDLVDGGDRVVALGRFCGRPKANGRYVEIPFARGRPQKRPMATTRSPPSTRSSSAARKSSQRPSTSPK